MSHQTETKVVSLTNRLNDLDKIAGALEDIAELWSLPVDLTMTLNLVIEEAFTNVVNYAFQDESVHDIELVIQKIDNRLVISLKDDGVAYDPTLNSDPDISMSARDREIGGLGIFLIKKMMDKVSYERRGEANILTMEKLIAD